MVLVKIYVLIGEGEGVRYVGATRRRLCHRLYGHWVEARTGKQNHKAKWLRKCHTEGRKVTIVELESVAESEWKEREIHWIASFGNLTNIDPGGFGLLGRDEATKKKVADAVRRSLQNPVRREAHAAMLRRTSADPSVRAKISLTVKALHADPGYQERRRDGLTKRLCDPQFHANLRDGASRRSATPEWRANQSAAAKRRWADPVYRENQAKAIRRRREITPCS